MTAPAAGRNDGPMASSIDRDVERLSGGLDRSTLVVAGVATLGLIMAVLDTTIVNVALDTLSRDLHAPLSTIQWVSTGYLLSLAAVIPLSGWITERFGSKRDLDRLDRAVRRRLGAVRAGDVGRRADRLPRPAGPRRRHARAGRIHAGRAERRASERVGRALAADRSADPARADLRAHHRRPDRRQRGLAVDLPRQRADRRRGDRRRRPAAPAGRRPRRRRRARLASARRCCAQGWRASSSACRRPRATAA